MAARAGRQLVNEGARMNETFAPGVRTAPTDDQGAQGGAKAVAFERKFGGSTRMDDEMNLKMSLMDDQGKTPFGQVIYDDKVGRWLQRKEDTAEVANLDAWFGKEFNKASLAERQFAQQIYPEYYSSRESELVRKTQAALELKMIQLRGPQSQDDLYKLWLINTGRVVLPGDWDRIGGSAGSKFDAAEEQRDFKQGLFRLPRIKNQAQRTTNAGINATNRAWGSANAASGPANFFSSAYDDKTDNGVMSNAKNTPAYGMYQYAKQ